MDKGFQWYLKKETVLTDEQEEKKTQDKFEVPFYGKFTVKIKSGIPENGKGTEW